MEEVKAADADRHVANADMMNYGIDVRAIAELRLSDEASGDCSFSFSLSLSLAL